MPETEEKIFSRNLSYFESFSIMKRLASPDASDQERIAFLKMLHDKGITSTEMAGFSAAIRSFARISPVDGVSDIVGTGGDLLNTINVSTAAAITASAMGIKIAKHGNRAVTGKVGSADFLSRIGYRFDFDYDGLLERINEHGFAFLLAPQFNGTFRIFSEARKQLPYKTVFNYMGPVTNPADPQTIIIGSSDPSMLPVYAGLIYETGKTGAVITAQNGMDEISPSCRSRLLFVNNKISEIDIEPEKITGSCIEKNDIASSDPDENFKMTLAGIRGEDEKISKFIALNTAPLIISRKISEEFAEAYEISLEAILSGKAGKQLEKIGGRFNA
ncbi:anthranilate phosphoribosyltransferase [Oxyplasma meridianum]|uniref:Anthranilate phosphoribosyltransferase n=1 Tax=Oxyplasma meridianum TaxID=3073602 RepID=A0AAX4NG18_9ARCH